MTAGGTQIFERYGSLPFSILGCYGGSALPRDGLSKLYSHLHAFGQFLRFVTVVQVCDYINDPASRTLAGDTALGLLRRPSLGHWISVARTLGICLSERASTPFLWEWVECRRDLERTIVTLEGPGGPIKAAAVDAVIALRNALAHGALPPGPDQVEVLNLQLVHTFQLILDRCLFLGDVDAVRVVRRDKDETTVAIMRGFDVKFETRPGEERFLDGMPADLYLERKSNPQHWISADALLVAADDDLTEPMLTFDGIGSRSAYYIGIRRRIELPATLSWLTSTVFAPPVNRAFTVTPALQSAAQQTIQAVEALRGSKYFPECYQDRPAISAIIEELAREARPLRTGLLLAAESGAGKTSLLAHTALRLIGEDNPVALPVWVSNATPAGRGAGPIASRLAAIFEVAPAENPAQLLEAIEGKLGPRFLPGGGNSLLLMVDALNEFDDPAAAVRDFDALVQAARRYRWLRCVGTIRRGSLDMISAQTDGPLIDNPGSYYAAASLETAASVAIPLVPFSMEEAELAWERQRRVAAERDLPCCDTPFEGLSSQVQESVRHPLVLEMTMRLFAGRLVPRTLTGTQLFELYHDSMLSPAQQKLAEACAAACVRDRSRSIPADVAAEAIALWTGQRDPIHRLVELDPIQQLLDLGTLSRRNDTLGFTHQLYFEFLIGRHIESSRPDVAQLLSRLSDLLAPSGGYLEEEVNAARNCLFTAWASNRIAPSFLLEALSNPAVATAVVPFFMRLRNERPADYANLVDAAALSDRPEELDGVLELVRTLGDRAAEVRVLERTISLRPAPDDMVPLLVQISRAMLRSGDIAASRQALDTARQLVDDSLGRAAFDVLCESGYNAFFVGRSLEALDAYAQALSILDDPASAVHGEDSNRRRTVLNGLGCAAHNLDRNDQALKSHAEAVEISRAFGDRAAESIDLVNLADAYWGCGNIEKALEQYDLAIKLSSRVWYDDGRDVALIGRGAVLASIGESAAALRLIDEGIGLATQLKQDWDRAWGLVYRGVALLISNETEAALTPLSEARATALSIQAGYLTALAGAMLHWASELHDPGRPDRGPSLAADIGFSDEQGFVGPGAFLAGIAILHSLMHDPDHGRLQSQLDRYAHQLAALPPIKGPLEHLLHSILVRVESTGRRLDVVNLETRAAAISSGRRQHLNPARRDRYDAALHHFCH